MKRISMALSCALVSCVASAQHMEEVDPVPVSSSASGQVFACNKANFDFALGALKMGGVGNAHALKSLKAMYPNCPEGNIKDGIGEAINYMTASLELSNVYALRALQRIEGDFKSEKSVAE